MRNLLVTLVLHLSIIFFACKPTDIQEIQDTRSFCEKNLTEGSRIERTEYHYRDGIEAIKKHFYNTQGLLTAIKSINNNVTIDTFLYDVKNRLVAKIEFTSITSKGGIAGCLDTLIYNNEGKVSKIATYKFSNYGAIKSEFGFIDLFYNLDGKFVKDTNTNQALNSYEWENGNLIRVKTFNTIGSDVLWEKIFTYDNKVNPYPSLIKKGSPYIYNYFDNHDFSSKNNVVKVEFKSYVNTQSQIPFILEYCYNAQGFPILIKNSLGDSTLIFYEK